MRKTSTSICFDKDVEALIDKDIKRIEKESGLKLSRSAYLSALVRLHVKENDEVCNSERQFEIQEIKQASTK